jgi:hypothetical protein
MEYQMSEKQALDTINQYIENLRRAKNEAMTWRLISTGLGIALATLLLKSLLAG